MTNATVTVKDSTGLSTAQTVVIPGGVSLVPFGQLGGSIAQASALCPPNLPDRRCKWRAVFALKDQAFNQPVDIASYDAAGFDIMITARWMDLASGPPADFGTWTKVAYQSELNTMLDSYPATKLVVVEDEQNVLGKADPVTGKPGGQFTVPGDPTVGFRSAAQNIFAAQCYGQMLEAAAEVCHPRGVLVSDGGIVSAMAMYLTYQDLVLQGKQAEADLLWTQTADAFESKTEAAAKYATGIEWIKVQAAAAAAGQIDLADFHHYNPDHGGLGPYGGLDTIAAFFAKSIGKPPMCGEAGVRDTATASVQALVDGTIAGGLQWTIFYTGGGGPANAAPINPATNGAPVPAYIEAHY